MMKIFYDLISVSTLEIEKAKHYADLLSLIYCFTLVHFLVLKRQERLSWVSIRKFAAWTKHKGSNIPASKVNNPPSTGPISHTPAQDFTPTASHFPDNNATPSDQI